MKYILMPVWAILVVVFTCFEVVLLILFNVITIIWHFSIEHTMDWYDMTEKKTYGFSDPGYDKSPKETIIRRITNGDYKNYKN